MKTGAFVISLDFELRWGTHLWDGKHNYDENILGAREAIPKMLSVFERYNIHVTWAIVGALFAEKREDLLRIVDNYFSSPEEREVMVSFIDECENLKEDEKSDPTHFALSLIKEIKRANNQEIGLHTFSHFFCLDNVDNNDFLKKDTLAALELMHTQGVYPTSFVFPKNQFTSNVLTDLYNAGLRNFRGNEAHVLYKESSSAKETIFRRMLRLIDSYYNISGYHTYTLDSCFEGQMFNIPSSRFLRPYCRSLRLFEKAKIARIKNAMTYASKHGEIYHLWFHPHNFGKNTNENMDNLKEICEHFQYLQKKYGFISCTMSETMKLSKGE